MKKKYLRNWFSNMLPFDIPFVEDGVSYRTPEHYYQAMKMSTTINRDIVAHAKNGTMAKKLGRTLPMRKDWESVKVLTMRVAQYYRFREGSSWRVSLMNTSGDIVEVNNWHDNFWGNCVCAKCKDKQGLNMLGKILMEIREDGGV